MGKRRRRLNDEEDEGKKKVERARRAEKDAVAGRVESSRWRKTRQGGFGGWSVSAAGVEKRKRQLGQRVAAAPEQENENRGCADDGARRD